MTSKKLHPETIMIHDSTTRSQFNETSDAIFMTSGYIYDKAETAFDYFRGEKEGFVYSRYANPTVKTFEKRMAALEGAEDALATSSGMAAVNAAITSIVKSGDRVVAGKALFSSCRYILETILPNFGVEVVFVEGTNIDEWQQALNNKTSCVFLETPTNPMLDIADIKKISELAHNVGAKVIVDNVFATPVFQKPFKYGADIVVYSATKHIDGQGRCLGGIVISNEEYIKETLFPFLKHTGPSMSPFNAWCLIKGCETLSLRINKMTDNAETIANYIENQASCEEVIYPHHKSHNQYELAKKQMLRGSNLVTFKIKGTQKEVFKFENSLQIIKISNNLGDSRSLITHPATTTHYNMSDEDRKEINITDNTIRLSVGLEHVNDIIEDLERGFHSIK